MKDLDNKVAVITGAASGIGRELARIGAAMKMRLVLADIRQDALEEIATELRGGGSQVVFANCDVRYAEQVQALAALAMREFGVVHMVFNNAGVGTGGLIWETTPAEWERILGVNLWGAIHGIHTFVPRMLASANNDRDYKGYIVNTASVAGLVNAPNLGAYNASKHALVSLSETLYHDLKLVDAPIGVSVLCPYFVATAIHTTPNDDPEVCSAELTPSQKASELVIAEALKFAKLSAAEVAQRCFEAVSKGMFYIFPHGFVVDRLKQQTEEIVAHQNPSDPYAAVPYLNNILRLSLRVNHE